ncbi:FtsL-like putative cell division protein [Hymenobacter busanensis]|uniref:FtsL-like putative cell division protein n=1 Tax=Hymenobacter busanensis TaxID=2607656 RepID=UPI00191BEAEE|nr:FtsL-like putative cell division protein [Hymenobacter busanensis]
MAVNTLRPTAGAPRQNTPREVAPLPAPEPPKRAPEPQAEPEPEAPRKPRKQSSWSIFSLLESVMRMDGLFRDGVPVRFLPHTLFVMFLILLYIGNTHYATRMNRNIQKLKTETEDLRADYTTLSSDYMEASKQSEVARKVAAYGLVESSSPPFHITVPAGELNEDELARMPLQSNDSLAVARAASIDSASTAFARADSVADVAEHAAANAALRAARNKSGVGAKSSKPAKTNTGKTKPAAKAGAKKKNTSPTSSTQRSK